MRVIEGSAFVAAPSGGMTLAQLGAEVIRFDNIGGGIDYKRWPLTESGESLYWTGLNKNKRSIAVNLRESEAQELLAELIVGAGNYLTNFPARGWMSWETLSARRPDLNMVAITGNRDGTTAIDYTVNAAIGFPFATGPVGAIGPVNNVLAAWDLICGQTAALAMLAADRHRVRTGDGSQMSIALFDVALAATAALGHVAEAEVLGTERQRFGNDLYGAYGTTFTTNDDVWIYAAGISPRQWSSLLEATRAGDAVGVIESELELDFSDEGDRFAAREDVTEALQAWVGSHTIDEVGARFDELGVCWGRYQSFLELVRKDARCSLDSELFRSVDHPNVGTYITPGSPIALAGLIPVEPAPAPRLGADTEPLLVELGLTAREIGNLVDRGIVATNSAPAT